MNLMSVSVNLLLPASNMGLCLLINGFLEAMISLIKMIARKKIDEYLKILNDDYRVERIAAIRDVMVEVLPTKVFYDYMKLHGREGGQHKFPRVLKNNKISEWEDYLNSVIVNR